MLDAVQMLRLQINGANHHPNPKPKTNPVSMVSIVPMDQSVSRSESQASIYCDWSECPVFTQG